MTSGFGEAGDAGRRLQDELEQVLADAPYRLLGPNCEGYVFPEGGNFITFSPMPMGSKAGPVGVVAQSGAISGAIVNRLNRMGVGVRALVTTGNECDITAADVLEWFAQDSVTTTIVCYLEQIREPQRFVAAARAMRGKKPIVIQKPGRGRASSEAVTTHTGAIAGDDRVVDGVFEELQIVRAYDHSAAVDAAAALSLGRGLRGLRIGIVSIAGGLAVEACDLCEAAGFEVPRFDQHVQAKIGASLPYFAAVRNPVDLTGVALSSPEMFSSVIDLVLEHGGVDALIVVITFSHQAGFAHVLLATAAKSELPVIVVWTAPESLTPQPLAAFKSASFPVFDSPARAVAGLRAIARFSGLL
jgi:acyl-CoA synthetase (NDP forming)